MRWLRFAIFILIAALIQGGNLLNLIAITPLNIKPDFLLVLLVFFAVNCDPFEAIITSFAIGLAGDIIGSTIGPCFLAFGLVGTSLAHIRKLVMLRKTANEAIAILAVGLIAPSLAWLLYLFKGQPATINNFAAIAATALYSALAWFVVHWVVSAAAAPLGLARLRPEHRRKNRL